MSDLPPTTPRDPALLKQLLEFLAPHRRLLATGVLCLLGVFAADLAGPYLIRQTLDGPVTDLLGTEAGERYLELRPLANLFLGRFGLFTTLGGPLVSEIAGRGSYPAAPWAFAWLCWLALAAAGVWLAASRRHRSI